MDRATQLTERAVEQSTELGKTLGELWNLLMSQGSPATPAAVMGYLAFHRDENAS